MLKYKGRKHTKERKKYGNEKTSRNGRERERLW